MTPATHDAKVERYRRILLAQGAQSIYWIAMRVFIDKWDNPRTPQTHAALISNCQRFMDNRPELFGRFSDQQTPFYFLRSAEDRNA